MSVRGVPALVVAGDEEEVCAVGWGLGTMVHLLILVD
jgi:hypothetical protein